MTTDHRITLQMAADAHACLSRAADGTWLLLADLTDADGEQHAQAVQAFGQGDAAALAAHSRARLLRRGATVQVHCTRWRVTAHGRLLLTGVSLIDPIAPSTHTRRVQSWMPQGELTEGGVMRL